MRAVLFLLLALCLWFDASLADDICDSASGTITAELSSDPGYEGLYKYTIVLDKYDEDEDDEYGFYLNLDLKSCECRCEDGFIVFPQLAGHIPGDDRDDFDGECDVVGEYFCQNSPEVPAILDGPVLRFSKQGEDDCDGDDDFRSVQISFYTPLPPGDYQVYSMFLIDDDDDDDGDGDHHDEDEEDGSCAGTLSGVLPICECSVGVEDDSWSAVKSRYDD